MSSASSSGSGSSRQPKAPAWKGSRAATVQRKTTAAGGGGTTWRKEREPDERPQVARIIAVLLAVALLGAFLYFAIVRPRATPLVVFAAEPYPLRMPPLAFAQEDAALLESIAPQNLQVRKEYRAAFQHLDGALDRFKAAIQAAGRSSRNLIAWRDQAMVIHLAAHGAVDERGACLIPPAADPFDSRQWLPLKEVLAALKDEPAMRGKRKLLVLDCQRVLSNWRTGLLENRFAEELPRAVEEAADPNLYVFASAAPGQLAWPAPELRGSVFGYFLARGLRGEANPEGKTVSLEQLVAYVVPHVESYVVARRAARQQPVLLHADGPLTINPQGRLASGDGETPQHDFSLVYVDSARRATDLAGMQLQFDSLAEARKLVPRSTGNDTATPTALQASYTLPDVWRLYDERRAGQSASGEPALPAYVVDPVAWASVQQRLAAIHERLLAGAAYQPSLPDGINELGRELAADQWRPSGKRPPLGLSKPVGQSSALSYGDNFLEAYLKEQDPAKRAELAKRSMPREKIVGDIYSLFTRANRPLTEDDWQAAQQLLGLHPPAAESESLADHFLTLLQKGLRTSDPSFAALVPRALVLRQAAEAAAVPADLRVHFAAERLLHDSDAKRRDAEDQLFLGDPRQQAAALYSVALDGDEQVTGYRKTIEHQEKLAEAYRLRDEVWSELPLVAEWLFLRRKLASASAADETALSARASDQLVELIVQSIDLNDQLEQVARSREEAGTFSRRLADCQAAAGALAATWRDVRAGLDEIAGPLVTREDRYLAGRDIREVELVTKTALLAPEFPRTILGLYLQTLDEWTKGELPQLRQPESAAPAASASWQTAEQRFLEQLHRLLAYEFRVGYDKHLVSTAWEGDVPADRVFRGAGSAGDSSWVRLHELLDKYDEEMQRARSPVWDSARSALTASQELRTWDRRVRVAAPWLSCFSDELDSPVQARPGQAANHATPARWLQEFDAAHLIALHAARAASDFWGSGEATPSAAPPFFAAAVRRCEDLLQTLGSHYAPLRYDPPAAGAADVLALTQDSALAALRKWDPLKLPGAFSPPAGPDAQPTALRIDIQPAVRDPLLQIPPGTAALAVPPAALGSSGGVRFTSDAAGKQAAFPVKLPLTNSEAVRVQAYAHYDESAATADPQVAARLWYRGHVRAAVLPISGPGQFVETLHQRKPYSVPTIEVRGKDTPRGAVMFIFDCSNSMRAADNRFAQAKTGFQELLQELANDAGDSLHVGLSFYGRKAAPGRPRANPNPDRDVTDAVALGPGKAAALLAEMNNLQLDDCMGLSTPLYYSIHRALDHAFAGIDRSERRMQQIVVISDGVNIPYDSTHGAGQITINPGGKRVNDEDLAALKAALRNHPETLVTVKLFGAGTSRVEREQMAELDKLEASFPSFKVVVLPSAKELYQSIRDSFPKTAVELASAGADQPQKLALNKETPANPWQPADGLLRLVPEDRQLLVRVAGEANTTLKKPLALVGGEKIVLQYDSQTNQPSLRFIGDQRRERANEPATVKSGLAEPALDLRVAALDPYRKGGLLDTLFVRLRHEQASQQFTPRPKYIWAEIDPLGAPVSEPTIPVTDAAWEDHTELPILQIPVRAWPSLASQARIRVWFRYNDPQQFLAQARLRRGQSTPPLDPSPGSQVRGRWLVEEAGGEGGQERKLTVTFEPAEGERRYEYLLQQAVWLSPPPDQVHRRLAKDGSQAVHEFTYTRAGVTEALELRIASREQFERAAYYAELTVNVVD